MGARKGPTLVRFGVGLARENACEYTWVRYAYWYAFLYQFYFFFVGA